MSKYIPAEKLKEYLADKYEVCPINDDERHGRHCAIIEIQNFIDSLQQKQTDELLVPIWCLKVIQDTLQIEYNAHCEKETGETCQDRNIKACLNSVTKILNGEELTGMERLEPLKEKPEVDLEKEYTEFVESDPVYSKLVNGIVGKSIARHFAEWGAIHLNARK